MFKFKFKKMRKYTKLKTVHGIALAISETKQESFQV